MQVRNFIGNAHVFSVCLCFAIKGILCGLIKLLLILSRTVLHAFFFSLQENVKYLFIKYYVVDVGVFCFSMMCGFALLHYYSQILVLVKGFC